MCICSVGVYECELCGDSDYGTTEAEHLLNECNYKEEYENSIFEEQMVE